MTFGFRMLFGFGMLNKLATILFKTNRNLNKTIWNPNKMATILSRPFEYWTPLENGTFQNWTLKRSIFKWTQNSSRHCSLQNRLSVRMCQNSSRHCTYLTYFYSHLGPCSALDIAVWSDVYPLFHTPEAEKILSTLIPGKNQISLKLVCLTYH